MELTDSSGELADRRDYDAYGQAVFDTQYEGTLSGEQYDSGLHQPFGYNAEATDPATALQYLRARYYDPETGSFLSSDSYSGSLTDPLSQNRYTYTQNNPVNYIDPSGHSILGRVVDFAKNIVSTARNCVVSGANRLLNGDNMSNIHVKKYIFFGTILILVIISAYYLFCLFSTREIMNDLNLVAQGGKALNRESDVILQKKMPWTAEDDLVVSQIKRHFTLCFGNKGKIWIHYKVKIHFSDGGTLVNQMRDQVIIEKKKGKWIVTDYISPP